MLTRDLSSGLWLLGGLASAILLVALSFRMPSAVGVDAAVDRFSAERAMLIVRRLCDEIGMRPNGTAAQQRAAEMLAEELRRIPGVVVEVQRAGGVHQYRKPPWPFPPFVYRTVNVVARLEGSSQDALLLNAHYDTSTDSVGAGDDAMAVAAIVEVLRALATGPKLEHSLVLNLNGGEEIAMLGAAGFLQHRWAKDVRAYLYVDGGPRGRPVVLGAGPGNAWLLREYFSSAVAAPASIVGQDLIDKGLLLHSGDFLPFHEAGLVGIDFGPVDDFWSVHTSRDRPERIDLDALQLMGDSLLAGSRRLVSGSLPGNVDRRPTVYYDVAGLFMIVYPATTARALALAALGLAALALGLAVRRKAFTTRQLIGALGRLVLAELAALLAVIIVVVVLGLVLRRPHGWFSSPSVAVWVFAAAAIAAALGFMAWRRRRRPGEEPKLVAWAAALLFWGLLLVAATAKGIGAGYVALWWTGGLTAGLIGLLLAPRFRGPLWLMSFLPGAVLVLGLTASMFRFVVADIGLVPAPIPLDLLPAVLIAGTVALLLPSILAWIGRARRLGWVAAACAVVAIAGGAFAAARNPYSLERPKRITAVVEQRAETSHLFLGARDPLPLGSALRDVPEAVPWSGETPSYFGRRFTYRAPAGPLGFEAPRVDVLSSAFDDARGVRVVRVRVMGGNRLRFLVPRARIRAWSLGPIPTPHSAEAPLAVVFENAAPADRELTLELVGSAPVGVELDEIRGPSRAPEVQALERRLPTWTALDSVEISSFKSAI